MIEIVCQILLFSSVIYCCFVAVLTFSWLKTKEINIERCSGKTKISIIIAARNEAQNIGRCLSDLGLQTYHPEHFEVIVVDDCSEDETSEIALKMASRVNAKIRIVKLNEISTRFSGKKKAITEAVKIANGDLIITTDADCTFNKNWLSSMVAFYERNSYKMVIGPVSFKEGKGLFHQLQEIEFMSLIGATAALAGVGTPVMCNGANLLYEKKVFEQLDTYKEEGKASGDDVFLLHDVKRVFDSQKIGFIKCKDAIVSTAPSNNIKEFFNQRKRWASKSVGYKDVVSLLVSLVVLTGNLSALSALVLLVFSTKFVVIAVGILVIKSLFDFAFLYAVSGFFDKRKYAWLFVPEQFVYMLYVGIIGFASFFGKYEWKGRKLS